METEPQLIADYVRTGKVQIVYRHLLQLGPGSLSTGEASECAGAQGKFWQTRKRLYELHGALPADLLQQVGIDANRYATCMNSHQSEAAVEADNADAVKNNIVGRPYFIIGGDTRLIGSQPYSVFQRAIDAKLR
ncbi:MAG: thioredoxin domain-containing protein [Herpetosiphonaceae bacterium]|nr:thioredoxin domain-containing protein [Herpetosiphonaceae bacterium]